MLKHIAALFTLIVVSGCSTLGSENKAMSKYGPADLFERPVEQVDILALVSGGEVTSEKLNEVEFSRKFDETLRIYGGKIDQAQRNRIQDRLVLGSNEACENYKTVLKRKQSNFNFLLGTAATIFGAAGGVVHGVNAANTLSALSGISSGVRAEYNQDYYADVTAHVITKGITARRKDILEVMATAKLKSVAEYSLEFAIADAIIYHGACSLIAGLERSEAAVSRFNNNAGLDALGANPFAGSILNKK